MLRILTLFLCFIGPSESARMVEQTAGAGASISIRPAEPPSVELQQDMERWGQIYRQQMAPVRHQWSRVVSAIHEGRISDMALVCPEFKRRVAELDRKVLLQAPDPSIRTWLATGLDLLGEASDLCRRDRYFALGFRLYLARHLIRAVDRRLQTYP